MNIHIITAESLTSG